MNIYAHGNHREQVIRDVLLAQQPNKRFATVEELALSQCCLQVMRRLRSPEQHCQWMVAGLYIEAE